MTSKSFPCITILSAILLTGCVDSPDSVGDNQEEELTFEYTEIRDVSAVKTLEDGSILVKMDLEVENREFSCYGKISRSLAESIAEEDIIHKIELKRNNEGHLIVDTIQSGMGLYGGSQYWFAFSWLSAFLPYVVAHTVSLVVPVIVFFIILSFGFVFVEF